MRITQDTEARTTLVTPRFAGLAIKPRGNRPIISISPKSEHLSNMITAMNPGETIVYHQKPCVVLDALHEGYPELKEHVLLEELTHYAATRGRVRHLAHLNDLDKVGREDLPGSPAE